MTLIEELSDAVARITADVGPSVVGLGRGWGLGSGVVVADGQVLTNAHNLRGEETTVTFLDGRREAARVAASDGDGDLAVLSVETGDARPLAWREQESEPGIGTPVFALANPGGRGLRVTFGLVSATGRSFRGPRGRRIHGTLEHTAPLPRGSSGGPIVDGEGRLLGLNTVRLEGGLILALAAGGDLRERVDALAAGRAPARVRLGVAVAPPRAARRLRRAVGLPERDGVLVREVEEGAPAAQAGVEQGDLIVAVEGEPIRRLDDLFGALDRAVGRSGLELTVVRGVDERPVTVPLASADAA